MTNVIHDEKLLLILGQSCVDYFRDSLGLELEKEAYGPSLNEGICYEKCFRFDFEGTVQGHCEEQFLPAWRVILY